MGIKLFIENTEYSLESIWFHYRETSLSGNQYKIQIPIDSGVIRIIESYSGVSILDDKLSLCVLEKDRIRLSMGLMWNLLLWFQQNGYINKSTSEPITWTINNIKQIVIREEVVVISGDVSK
jgi:hypothetical protein